MESFVVIVSLAGTAMPNYSMKRYRNNRKIIFHNVI